MTFLGTMLIPVPPTGEETGTEKLVNCSRPHLLLASDGISTLMTGSRACGLN